MNVWDLTELGITHYALRKIVYGCSDGDPRYQWLNEALITQGLKKPKVDAEKFLELYREFRTKEVSDEFEEYWGRLRAR